MNRAVPGQQPLRATPGNVFAQSQPQQSSRNTSLGSGRLQNAKISNSSAGWSGMNMASAHQQGQVRPSNATLGTSFAQTIGGGSQNHTPLDLSEFPSLSGAPQQSQSSSSTATWGNPGGIRLAQRGPQSQAQPSNAPGAPTASQQQQQRSDASRDSTSSPFPPMNANEFRIPNTSGYRDEVPRGGGLDGVDATGARAVGIEGVGDGDDGVNEQRGGQGLDDGTGIRSHGRSNTNPFGQPPTQLPFRQTSSGGPNSAYGLDQRISPTQEFQSGRSEQDKWGLPGLIDKLRGPYPDQVALALGTDLNTLGLDLSRPSHEPLCRDWGGPFADPTRPSVVPDFKVPESYTVRNVPALLSKISSFSDETLFMIFYQFPRDVKQHAAAAELYQRDWRWHKKLAQWMMKAKEHGEPQPLASMKEERGYYYFFDADRWERQKKEFILNYEHLYHPPDVGGQQPLQPGQQGQQGQPPQRPQP